MAHKKAPKVTPESAKLNYEAFITEKAKEFSPMLHDAFKTETSLLIAIDNSVRFLNISSDAFGGKVSAEYFILHGPLSEYPDQSLSLMVLFVASGVFVPEDSSLVCFNIKDSSKWFFYKKR